MSQPLFRQEALARQSADWLAPVHVASPPGLRWTIGLVLAVVMAGGWLLASQSYTRKASLSGVLAPEAGLSRLSSPYAAQVADLRVREGQTVRRGEVLLMLRPAGAALLDGAQAEVQRSLARRRETLEQSSQLQRRLTQTRLEAVQQRLLALAAEQSQLDAETLATTQRLALSQAALERLRGLQAQSFVSPAQTQGKEEEVLAVQAQLQSLRRQRAVLQRERAELEGERASLPVQGAQVEGELARGLALVSRESAEIDPQRQWPVLAPHDGVVTALLVRQGQTVPEAGALLAVLPAGSPLQAELFAPSSAVGLIRPGMSTRVRYDAFPYQRFGLHVGRVREVSAVPLNAAELAALSLTPGDTSALAPGGREPVYRVLVDLDPGDAGSTSLPQGSLRAGMRLQADVWLETRRWIEWVLAPARGVALRL